MASNGLQCSYSNLKVETYVVLPFSTLSQAMNSFFLIHYNLINNKAEITGEKTLHKQSKFWDWN